MSSVSADPEPAVDGRGATILGPRNVAIDRWPFSLSHNRVLSGGFARETTTRELPVSTEIAGVSMRLTPGGSRELHWHKEAEWAYVIAGSCRVSQWMGVLPPELVKAHLNLDDATIARLPKTRSLITC
jgi:oxalate decarboxylase